MSGLAFFLSLEHSYLFAECREHLQAEIDSKLEGFARGAALKAARHQLLIHGEGVEGVGGAHLVHLREEPRGVVGLHARVALPPLRGDRRRLIGGARDDRVGEGRLGALEGDRGDLRLARGAECRLLAESL